MGKSKNRGNGQGSAYKLPNGKWRAAVTLGYNERGKRIYRAKSGFRTKKEALDYIPTLRETIDITEPIKFSKLYAEWSAAHYRTIGEGKRACHEKAYERCEPLYHRKFADLRLKDLQHIVDTTTDKRAPKSDIKVLLNMMYEFAMRNDYVIKNYATYIVIPASEQSKRDSFTGEEVDKLWSDYNSGNEFTGYILTLIYTGLRLGELEQMRKDNVNLKDNTMIGGIKTDAGKNRTVVISKKLKPVLTKIYLACNETLLEMTRRMFYYYYYAALKRAGVRALSPHCCRHTFATMLAESGAQPAVIKEVIGHTSYSTTIGYTHISADKKLDAVNQI